MIDLNFKRLRVFEATAACGSLSRASDLLGVSLASVSQQVRQLEQDVGMQLIDTSVRPVQVTEAGHELLRHARVILAQISVASEAIESLDSRFRGRLCLGVVQPANYFAPRLMEAFRCRYPEIRVKLIVGQRDRLMSMLTEHEIELAIGGFPPVQAEIEVESFARNPHYLVAHPAHRLARRRNLSWRDLAGETFVFREKGSMTRSFLEHLLQSHGIQVNAEWELEGGETVKQAVMAGLGISFLSQHVIENELQYGKLVRLDVTDTPKSLDWCVWRRREQQVSKLPATFIRFLIEEGARICNPEPLALAA